MVEVLEAVATKVHVFAHLGPAPYRFLRYRENWFSVPGGEKKPGGSCDHCGTSIAYEFWFRATDGREFKVGSSCVEKSDASLRRAVAPVERELAKAKNKARAEAKTARERVTLVEPAREALKDEAVRAFLATLPHPYGWAGKSLLDYADWFFANAGHSGKVAAAKLVLKSVPA